MQAPGEDGKKVAIFGTLSMAGRLQLLGASIPEGLDDVLYHVAPCKRGDGCETDVYNSCAQVCVQLWYMSCFNVLIS